MWSWQVFAARFISKLSLALLFYNKSTCLSVSLPACLPVCMSLNAIWSSCTQFWVYITVLFVPSLVNAIHEWAICNSIFFIQNAFLQRKSPKQKKINSQILMISAAVEPNLLPATIEVYSGYDAIGYANERQQTNKRQSDHNVPLESQNLYAPKPRTRKYQFNDQYVLSRPLRSFGHLNFWNFIF